MRHKYATPSIVLSRTPISEASAVVILLTSEVGLVRARAQGIRKPGAKMASALQTFVESDVLLLRGKDGWRLVGALHGTDWFARLSRPARLRAGRIASLILRLVHGEINDSNQVLYSIFLQFLTILAESEEANESLEDAAECLAALRILHALGVDAGEVPGGLAGDFGGEALAEVTANRAEIILRINRGIAASGL
jgi:DNA repair protein RecO